MAVRSSYFSRTEEVVWILIAFGLFVFEIRAIYQDRAEYTAKDIERRANEEETRRTQQEAFAALLQDGKDLFAQGKDVFDLSRKNLATLTGGTSFCYVIISPEKDKSLVYLIHSGENHIFDVYVRLDDLDSFSQAVKAGKAGIDGNNYEIRFGPIGSLQRGTLIPLATYPPIGPDIEAKSYNAFIMARNGGFTELIRLRRKADRTWGSAVLVTASYYDGKRGIVFKKIVDFPVDILKKDKDWTDTEKLPGLHIPN